MARAFALKDIFASHILSNGEILSQQALDKILLQKYFPDRMQLTLFPDKNMQEEEYLNEAYKLHNREIGYRMNL